jgi:hypothetical protein
MSYSEILDSPGFQICERCGNTYAVDAEDCSRCGAKGRAVPWAENFRHGSDFLRFARHPNRQLQTPESEPHQNIREEVPHRFRNQPRTYRVTLFSVATLLAIGLLIAVLAYTRTARQPVLASVSEHTNGSGLVAPVPSSSVMPSQSNGKSQPSSSSLTSDTAVGKSTADTTLPKAEIVTPMQDAATESANNIMARVRYSLKKGDLTDLRERLRRLPRGLQSEPEVRLLWGDLIRRERERDVALQDARLCEEGKDWPCVARYAAHVQTLDTGNADSQVMLAHAIGQIGTTRTAPSPLPNGPAQASVPPGGDR